MNYNRWLSVTVATLLLAGMLCGCVAEENEKPNTPEVEGTVAEQETLVTGVKVADQFTDRDKDPSYTGTAGQITLADNATAVCGGVSVSGNAVTIQQEGIYRLTGSLSDGRVVVDAPETAKIQLILDGVSITCSGFGALYVRQADKVFVTLQDDTENALISTGTATDGVEENVDATLYSKDDITINGAGSLTVTGPGHGLAVKADFVVTGGALSVTADGHAVQAKKSARIANGTFRLTAGKDGIHVENPDNTEEGYLYIAGGSYTVTASGDGFSAATLLQVSAGSGTFTCGGGSANGETHTEGFGGGFGGNRFVGWDDTADDTDSSTSAKGIKGGIGLLLEGGDWTLDTADDALHSNGDVTVKGGTLTIATGDDGVHADGATVIQDGIITVSKSYEGIEGNSIAVSGGTIAVTASDDGLNAAGGNDESGFGGGFGGRPDQFRESASGSYIRLSGGKLTVDASGDGIDSNGNLYVEGGKTYVSGPTNSGNGALDYGGSATVTGGVFCAVGASGMAQGFSEASGQGAILGNTTGMTSGEIVLTDKNGQILFRWTPAKSYSSVALTCPGLIKGETYTLSVGGVTQTVEMTDWIYGSSGGMGGMGGPGGHGGFDGEDFGGGRPGRP